MRGVGTICIVVVLGAATALSGCVGLIASVPDECPEAELLRPREQVLAARGQPREIARAGDEETWIYRVRKNEWCGLWVGAIILLPLMLPVCDEFDRITFKEEKPQRATTTRVADHGYLFGLGVAINPSGRCSDSGK